MVAGVVLALVPAGVPNRVDAVPGWVFAVPANGEGAWEVPPNSPVVGLPGSIGGAPAGVVDGIENVGLAGVA